MNICMFTNTYLPLVGGVSRSLQFFSENLRRLWHRVLVLAPSEIIAAILNENGVSRPVEAIPTGARGRMRRWWGKWRFPL